MWVAHAPGMPGTFPRHRGLAIPTSITARAWCMVSGSLLVENVPGIPGACATCNFAYLVKGPCSEWYGQCTGTMQYCPLYHRECIVQLRYQKDTGKRSLPWYGDSAVYAVHSVSTWECCVPKYHTILLDTVNKLIIVAYYHKNYKLCKRDEWYDREIWAKRVAKTSI